MLINNVSSELDRSGVETFSSQLNPDFELMGNGEPIPTYEGYNLNPPAEVIDICQKFEELGWRGLIVGGSVRDAIMNKEHQLGLAPKDFDIEVYGAEVKDLQAVLEDHFGRSSVHLVGKAFGVYKVDIEGWPEPLDFSVPREESQPGEKHSDIVVNGRPDMTIQEAAFRRDLTCNSPAYDPLVELVYDPYGGVEAIQEKILEVVDEEKFQEDPLRVVRLIQFRARFPDFTVADDTKRLCQKMIGDGKLEHSTKERISEEFKKLFLKGKQPSRGLEFAREIGFFEKHMPEIQTMICLSADRRVALEQDVAKWGRVVYDEEGNIDWEATGVPQDENLGHREGNLWEHTKQAVDAAVLIADREARAGNLPIKKYLEKRVVSYREQQEELALERLLEEAVLEGLDNGREVVTRIRAAAVAAGEQARKSYRTKEEARVRRKLKPGQSLSESTLEAVRAAASVKCFEERDRLKIALLKEEINNPASGISVTFEQIAVKARKTAEEETTAHLPKLKADQVKEDKLVLVMAALCHDLGKPATTEYIEGAWRSRGHEPAGLAPTREFLGHFSFSEVPYRVRRRILALVPEHLKPVVLYDQENPEQGEGVDASRAVRRLALRLDGGRGKGIKTERGVPKEARGGGATIQMLVMLAEADQRARNPQKGAPLAEEQVEDLCWRDWLLTKAEHLQVSEKPMELLVGGDEVKEALGITSKRGSPEVGLVLGCIRILQLEGELDPARLLEQGLVYRQEIVDRIRQRVDGDKKMFYQEVARAAGWWDPRVYPEPKPDTKRGGG